MSAIEFRHKDVWTVRGKNFLVEVSRHSAPAALYAEYEGLNRWCMYAYIYPQHPYFSAFSGPNMWQDAACAMPLHGGPSFLEYPMYEGKVTCVKVGADYNHLHDDRFTHYATKDEATEIFRDAADLFAWLESRSDASKSEAA